MSNLPPITDDELNAYLDNLLSRTERGRVEAALATQPALAQRLADLQQVFAELDLLKHADLPTPSHDLSLDVLRAIQSTALTQRATVSSTSVPTSLTAALCLQVALAIVGVAALLPLLHIRWPFDVFVASSLISTTSSVQSGFSQWLTWLSTVQPTVDLSNALPMWGLCFGAILLLWLVGNGVLLSPQTTKNIKPNKSGNAS